MNATVPFQVPRGEWLPVLLESVASALEDHIGFAEASLERYTIDVLKDAYHYFRLGLRMKLQSFCSQSCS